MIKALAETVDAKDHYTSGHSKRVARYASMIAALLGKDADEQERIFQAGLLHDVGKIRIPVEILNKPGKLDDSEFQIIRLHPISGYYITRSITDAPEIAQAAKYHHERYDGRGYPNGLSGEDIPEIARIIGVADTYDAMASNRSYRKALPQDVVRQEIEKGLGTQFDPASAKAMLELIGTDTDYELRQAELAQKQVLVVDDEPLNIQVVRNIMKEEPLYHLLAAASGRDALMIMGKMKVDLVLLDIEMPDMDGFETLRRIREKYQVPVVFLSADKSLKAIQRAEQAGAEDYLTKPFLPLELLEILQNFLLKQ